ncbi:hypothetical protein [Lentilactobacillus sp. SPB1-3]|uniref:Uncharacterized protein n=1 Tax=Lentilactobacillus terminaliae TaxID=3003483 RepID=A0ACD5DGA6_9LACO|nr:hypothetical protein [Lentilactobacillus sp. SPB1-3]MCZ0976900.1 hypothetical protein [Lentilactobacillus sp. SPB1-3]
MKKKLIFLSTLIGTILGGGALSVSANSSQYKPFVPKKLGIIKDSNVIKYNSVNWGWYDSVYQKKYFTSKKSTTFIYNKNSRTMIIRYVNTNKHNSKVKFNYMKLVFSHGRKNPTISYYYKLNNHKFKFINSVKYHLKNSGNY